MEHHHLHPYDLRLDVLLLDHLVHYHRLYHYHRHLNHLHLHQHHLMHLRHRHNIHLYRLYQLVCQYHHHVKLYPRPRHHHHHHYYHLDHLDFVVHHYALLQHTPFHPKMYFLVLLNLDQMHDFHRHLNLHFLPHLRVFCLYHHLNLLR